MPIVCPIKTDDPRISVPPYSLATGDRQFLQLPVGLLDTVVKRGWEPWTWTWSGLIDVAVDVFAYAISPGAVSGDDIVRPTPPLRTTVSPFLVQTNFRSFPVRSQPDFTIDENERPFWVDNVPSTSPVGPGGACPFKARAPIGGNIFPLAFNTLTSEVVGAILAVESTLTISLFSPYIWSDGSAYYCAVAASINSIARPAIAAELGADGNWNFAFYSSDWIFSGIDETSQELLGGTFDSTDPTSPQNGLLQFQDEAFSPFVPWGSIKMYGTGIAQIQGATVACVQHYGD